jgi:hypothetical protein
MRAILVAAIKYSPEFMALVRERLHYDPDSGELTWATRPHNSRQWIGKPIKGLTPNGYIDTTIEKKHVLGHRVAWFLYYGEWPTSDIDHINGIRNDNRIANLRLATGTQNQGNRKARGKRYLKGVSLRCDGRKFVAKIKTYGVVRHLGCFQTEEEAHQAYMRAAQEYFGEFARAA